MAADGQTGAKGRPCVGLVVVHGVGETEPGYCVNAIFDSLAQHRPGYTPTQYNIYTRLPEPGNFDPPSVFPVVRRGASHDSGFDIEAVELHWADLTMMQPGRINALLGLFRVIFESHHLVDAMLSRSGHFMSSVLRKLLWIAGWLLRGPTAALTIATSAICALFLFEPVTVGDMFPAEWQIVALQAVLFCAAIYVFIQIVRAKDYSWYDIVFWTCVMSAGILALVAHGSLLELLDRIPNLTLIPGGAALAAGADVDCHDPAVKPGCYINGLYKIIIWGWRAWGALMLLATSLLVVALFLAYVTRNKSRLPTLSTSIGILIMQFLLWTTVVVSVLYPMLNRAETISTLQSAKPIIDQAIANGTIPADGQVAKLVQVPAIELDWISRFKFIYAATAFTVMLLIVATWVLMLVRRRIARDDFEDLEVIARRMPRLLFNPVLVGLLIVAFLIVLALIFLQPYLDRNDFFVNFRNVVLPIAALAALASPLFFGHRVSNVVHIARDLIDHHYLPRLETAAYFFPSVYRARKKRPRRERIQNRLKLVLENTVKPREYDRVIFVAHSQGSVVVYDYLHDGGSSLYPELGGAAPSLLTFGSPLGSLYQKYFYEYAASQTVTPELASRLKCWINLYRVDDYIGGRITPPSGLRIDNYVMGRGGHTNYWTEREVAEALDAILTGKVADATKPPPLPMAPGGFGRSFGS